MTRRLYILDTETGIESGIESGHVDVTGMNEREIDVLQAQMRALCGDDAEVLDSRDSPLLKDEQ